MDNFPLADELVNFVKKRETARTNKPYGSGDPIIDTYRFCNINREHDRVTEWVAEHWRLEVNTVPALLMARLFNNPHTLKYIGYPYRWDPTQVKARAHEIADSGDKVFNAAYIVSTNGRSMNKIDYVVDEVLTPVFLAGDAKLNFAELEDVWLALTSFNGVGSFIGAQVIADLKYIRPWTKAADWYSFVAPGPGSMRGLNRLRGLEAKAQKYNQRAFSMYIKQVRVIIKGGTNLDLCAQNTQNTLCEFDKYMRAKTGEGRPKQKYKRQE